MALNPFVPDGPGSATAIPGSIQNPISYGQQAGVPPIKREAGDTLPVPGTGAGRGPAHMDGGIFHDDSSDYIADMSLYDAKVYLFQQSYNDQPGFLALQQQLIDAGYLDPRSRSYHPGQLSLGDATYKAYVNAARAAMGSSTPINDLLSSRTTQGLGQQYLSESKTSHASSVDLSNPTSVQALLTDSMRRLLGRAPTPNELNGAVASLNSLQRANPINQNTTTTTDSQYDQGQLVSQSARDSSSVKSGGVDEGQAVDNYVQGQFTQEADKHSINSYVDAFASLLRGSG